ncbi:hypothetical protein SUGI_0346910 [Cryptomeria japonica]|nr:hypothetical protein SUGI_0346910 [Cryptomeria japonica]
MFVRANNSYGGISSFAMMYRIDRGKFAPPIPVLVLLPYGCSQNSCKIRTLLQPSFVLRLPTIRNSDCIRTEGGRARGSGVQIFPCIASASFSFAYLLQFCGNLKDYNDWQFKNLFPEISATFSLENLRRVHLNMTLFYDPVPLLTCLLPHAPAMKTLLVSRKKGFDGINALQFLNGLLKFQREYTEIEIVLSRNYLKKETCLNCAL